jgi:Transposase family tnp2
VELHCFCSNCQTYLGKKKKTFTCKKCRRQFSHEECVRSKSFYLTSSIKDQLRDVLEKTDAFERIKRAKFVSKTSANGLRGEIVTGDAYRDPRVQSFLMGENNFSLTFSTDGIQAFNSNKDSLWPIFISINELSYKLKGKHIVLQGLWFGKKPKQETFLIPFVREARKLYSKGFTWVNRADGKMKKSRVLFLMGILDAPARAAFTCRHQWNGKCGCGWCLHPGTMIPNSKGKMGKTRTYPVSFPIPKRRNASQVYRDGKLAIKNRKHVNGVLGISLLHLLPNFDVVLGMIPDSMHCVYLGVTKMFLEIWTTTTRKAYSIKKTTLDAICNLIKAPIEISRTYRSLERSFSDWKASEFRNFLLFYSAPSLKNILPDQYYKHWLLLVNYMRILTQKNISNADLELCRKLAIRFTQQIPELYGSKFVRSNVHILQHIVHSTYLWGGPWSSSSFLYESLGGFLGDLFKGSKGISKQIFSNFMAKKCLSRLAEPYIWNADKRVKKFYQRLDPQQLTEIASKRIEPLGKGVPFELDFETRLVVERVIGHCNCKYVLKYQRCRFDNSTYSTDNYARKFKRDNSVVALNDGKIVVIDSIIRVAAECSCDSMPCHVKLKDEACLANIRTLFIVRELICSPISCVDEILDYDLLSFMKKIDMSACASLISIDPCQVTNKCIIVPVDTSHGIETFCVPVDNVLEGN